MADPVLKFPDKDASDGGGEGSAIKQRQGAAGFFKRYRRPLLLIVLPAIVLVGGFAFYLSGGRYVGTDDAYVGAQKVLITPEIAGKVSRVVVREGQHVNAGDTLFEIDPVPFQLALQQAQAKLDDARVSYATLKSNIKSYGDMLELARQGVELKQRDVERKTTLVKSLSGSQLDLDTATTNYVMARAQLELLQQQLGTSKDKLLGNPDLPLEQFPAYSQAKAALGDAQRNLDHTVLKAPIAGVATQVDNIQLGRFVAASTPILTVIDDARPWVDANMKESDLTYVNVGQKVDIEVDAFPNHAFHGTVGSLSPGTGAQFAILPPQNATGNFVKVVQRVPVRIYLDYDDAAVKKLKAGMSTYTTIDTEHRRTLAGVLGLSSAKAAQD
ncbi:HlyD family secretion protein [Tardiphaga sp.]|jgi:membrane fusion protein (multidrug efflux system)|uniref:HlyD family secretion protein n=1 Tax=Tardiphaga sp. TaxID=1926292 RepID=UPI0037D9DEB0